MRSTTRSGSRETRQTGRRARGRAARSRAIGRSPAIRHRTAAVTPGLRAARRSRAAARARPSVRTEPRSTRRELRAEAGALRGRVALVVEHGERDRHRLARPRDHRLVGLDLLVGAQNLILVARVLLLER